jgi:hypothetical protein
VIYALTFLRRDLEQLSAEHLLADLTYLDYRLYLSKGIFAIIGGIFPRLFTTWASYPCSNSLITFGLFKIAIF